jgi:hypothetical protein
VASASDVPSVWPGQVWLCVEHLESGSEHCTCGLVPYVPRADVERLRTALRRIADAESGHWGRIAHGALHPERAQKNEDAR